MKEKFYAVCIQHHEMQDGRVSHHKGAIYPVERDGEAYRALSTNKTDDGEAVDHVMTGDEYFSRFFSRITILSDAKHELIKSKEYRLDRGGFFVVNYGEVMVNLGGNNYYLTRGDLNRMKEQLSKK